VIDLARYVSMGELEELVARARVKGLIRDGELEAALARAGQRRGVAKVRAFLDQEGQPTMTRSKAERIVLALLRRSALPRPRVNVMVKGYLVDFLWEEERLIVEFDGFQFHGHRKAFEDDRRRVMVLADAGYQVIRITWRQLTEEPYVVIAHIARALGQRSRR
jgi:very-short-patch-repair endonuclease